MSTGTIGGEQNQDGNGNDSSHSLTHAYEIRNTWRESRIKLTFIYMNVN